MNRKFKVKIDYSGGCEGYSWKRNSEVVLPKSVLDVLGSNGVQIIEEVGEGSPLNDKPSVGEKDVKKPFFDRMVHGSETVTK